MGGTLWFPSLGAGGVYKRHVSSAQGQARQRPVLLTVPLCSCSRAARPGEQRCWSSLGTPRVRSCAHCRATRLTPVPLGRCAGPGEDGLSLGFGAFCVRGWWWFCSALWSPVRGQFPSGWQSVGLSAAHPGLGGVPPALGTRRLALVVEKA